MPDIQVRFVGGGSYVFCPPVLSDDGNFVFVAWKNVIFCYSTITTKRVGEFRGLQEGVVGFNYVCQNGREFMVAASKQGNVVIWDVPTTATLHEIKMQKKGLKFFQVLKLRARGDKFTLSALIVTVGECMQQFYIYDTTKIREIMRMDKRAKSKCTFGGGDAKFVVIINDNMLHFTRLSDLKVTTSSISRKKYFTAVACHPEDECVLTGDNTGRILAWRNFSGKPTYSKYHWHSLPVKTICFSPSGSSFFSGGDECVMVKWELENPIVREYLPRLPSSIEHVVISENNMRLAVSTEDNGIQILDPQLKLKNVIQHLVMRKQAQAGMAYDPRTKSLVLNSITGHVQFFRPRAFNLLYSLDIVCQNKVTGEREFTVKTADVTGVAISMNGKWMATVEQRKSRALDTEIRLKFWHFNDVDQTFQLNTCIELPHEKTINKVLFQPSNKEHHLKCATISQDGKFKIWQLTDVKTIYREGFEWKCLWAAFYKGLIPYDVAFSLDSSLLAVGFSHTVTTWLPDSCELKCSLLYSPCRRDIKQLAFGVGSHCHLIVTATSEEICVWNLLTLSMVWTVPINVCLLVSDPRSAHMAVFTRDNKLFVFTPQSPVPIYSGYELIKKERHVCAAVFVPNLNGSDVKKEWYQRTELYILDSAKDIYCIDAKDDLLEHADTDIEEINSSIFNRMLPRRKSRSLQDQSKPVVHPLDDLSARQNKLRDLLDMPVHTMPPIRLVCGSILRSLMEVNPLPTNK